MQNPHTKFKGTGVAIVTPFTDSFAIDFRSFEKLIDHTVSGKVDYLVLLGTTGESVTISKEEKKELIKFTVEKINNRVPLVLGIGGNNTTEVVQTIHDTEFKGIDAILSVCPYYNKPQQEGIYHHFMAVAKSSPVPVILYTVPGRTCSNISASTTLRLAADSKNIIGIKEASGNFDQVFHLIRNRPKDFLVISGDDGLTLPLLASGADGVISVVANAYPVEFSDMVRYGLRGDFKNAQALHYKLIDFITALFSDGSPSGIKASLELKKLCKNIVRLPLVPVRPEIYETIRKLILQIEI